MDAQARNFRDFLLIFNKLTEMCFTHCTDNFYTRNSSDTETACIDKCVNKFTAVNQKIMGTFVETQTAMNMRRAAEFEAQTQAAELAAKAAADASVAQETQTSISAT